MCFSESGQAQGLERENLQRKSLRTILTFKNDKKVSWGAKYKRISDLRLFDTVYMNLCMSLGISSPTEPD